jgi:hypothetical protein
LAVVPRDIRAVTTITAFHLCRLTKVCRGSLGELNVIQKKYIAARAREQKPIADKRVAELVDVGQALGLPATDTIALQPVTEQSPATAVKALRQTATI